MIDPDLQHQLTAADCASPPPPGSPITTARLAARLKLRRVRALATSAAIVLLGLGTWTLFLQPRLPTQTSQPDDSAHNIIASDIHAEIAQIASRIDRLLGDLATPTPEVSTDPKQLRFELATARANGLLAFQSNSQHTTSKEIR